ncbi:MAG: YidC/Oxa1 family insertase periplasmic-domain containing protein [Pirellulaceae bacterium]
MNENSKDILVVRRIPAQGLRFAVLLSIAVSVFLGSAATGVATASTFAFVLQDQETEATQDADPAGEKQEDSAITSGEQSDPAIPKIETPADVAEGETFVALNPTELLTIGSLNPDSPYRYLVTLSTKGGSVVRVELNARDRKGRLAYRDLEHRSGYIGKLEVSNGQDGLVVGVVGPGTPADLAGLRAGDVIVRLAFGDQEAAPVVSEADFHKQVSNTRVGDVVTVFYKRDGNESSANITMTDQPLEMINHEIDFVDPGISSPPSFLMQLLGNTDSPGWTQLDREMMNGEWTVEKSTTESGESVEFKFELTAERLAEFDIAGPIVVTKRFSIPKLSEELVRNLDSRSFHLDFDISIENKSETAIKGLGVQIDGPTGATTEGWWYQTKIHGRSTAIGYLAGARDVVSSTEYNSYSFLGCPEIVSESLKKSPTIQFIVEPPKHADEPAEMRALKFLGVDTQYFNIALMPKASETNTESTYHCYSAIARVASSGIPDVRKLHRKVDCTFMMFDKVDLEAGQTYTQSFEIFAGPKKKPVLQQYGLESTLTYGWFAMFSKFLCWLLRVFYTLTFQFSYGLAIILLTVLVRLCMLPISRRAAKNAQMMQLLGPEMKRIADKYKDDFEKRAQAQKDLFRRHNYNPAGGCLLMFFQLPIFIGLYRGLSVDIALRDQPLIPGMSWCTNLAAPDQFWYWKDWMPAFLGSEEGWLGPYFNILPLITIALFLVQQKLFTPPPTDEQQAIAQKMMSFMMIFMGVMFFKVPAGLCIYFITSSFWGIMERKLLPKPQLSEDRVNEIKMSLSDDSDEPKSKDASKGRPQNSLMDRFREAIEGQQKRKEVILDRDEQRAADRERKKRLKDRDRDR